MSVQPAIVNEQRSFDAKVVRGLQLRITAVKLSGGEESQFKITAQAQAAVR